MSGSGAARPGESSGAPPSRLTAQDSAAEERVCRELQAKAAARGTRVYLRTEVADSVALLPGALQRALRPMEPFRPGNGVTAFVVRPDGEPDPGLVTVVRATDRDVADYFASLVRRLRYRPAQVNGTAVAQCALFYWNSEYTR